MYLTAHRVLPKSGRSSGVNAFWYTHQHSPVAELDAVAGADGSPGHLVRYLAVIPPVQNRVLSFLDIVCPEEAALVDIDATFRSFVRQSLHSRLPWTAHIGACHFRFNLDVALSAVWADELECLFQTALSLRKGADPTTPIQGVAEDAPQSGQITTCCS